MQYITDEDVERAKKYGITKKLLYNRVYTRYWDKEKAITYPKQEKSKPLEDKWYKLAEKNNIQAATINWRVANGWTLEEAATTPPRSKVIKDNKGWKQIDKNRYKNLRG